MIQIRLEDGAVIEVPANFWEVTPEERQTMVDQALVEREVGGLGATESPSLPSATDQEPPLDAPSLVDTNDANQTAEGIVDRAIQWAEDFDRAMTENADKIIKEGGLDAVGVVAGDPKESVVPYVLTSAMFQGADFLTGTLKLDAETVKKVEEFLSALNKLKDGAVDFLTGAGAFIPVGVVWYILSKMAAGKVAKEALEDQTKRIGTVLQPRATTDLSFPERVDRKNRSDAKVGEAVYLALKKRFGAKEWTKLVGKTVGRAFGPVGLALSAWFMRSYLFGIGKAVWDASQEWLFGREGGPEVNLDYTGANKGALIARNPVAQHWSKGGKTLICK